MAKINGKEIVRNINTKTTEEVAEYITKLNDNKVTTEIKGNVVLVKGNISKNITIVKITR